MFLNKKYFKKQPQPHFQTRYKYPSKKLIPRFGRDS
jgi:hypothetical protein